MHRIGDRKFLHAWQRIRTASQPDPDAMIWKIGDVVCRRHRHSLMCPDHRIIVDVCHLEHGGGGAYWHVIVTAEHWWDNRRAPIRDQLWASHLAGSREHALSWFLEKAAAFETRDGFSGDDQSGP
jgi:hypothetical protein